MLPVFITTLAIEISSIVIIAAFCLFEDDVGLLDEEVIVTGAQLVVVHTIKGMLEEGVGNDGALRDGVEGLERALGIVLAIERGGLVGHKLRTDADHPRHLPEILGIDIADDAVDADLAPLLAFLKEYAATQSVVLHPQFGEHLTLHRRLGAHVQVAVVADGKDHGEHLAVLSNRLGTLNVVLEEVVVVVDGIEIFAVAFGLQLQVFHLIGKG